MAKRQFIRPAPGNRYTAEERAAWGAAQDRARADRASPAAQGIVEPKKPPAPRKSRAKGLIADVSASSCFNSLVYSGGEVIAQFAKDGSVYSYPLSRADAEDWFNAGSLGSYFNAEIR
jgi:hypothetical protein